MIMQQFQDKKKPYIYIYSHWIFYLTFKLTKEQEILIKKYFYTKDGWEDNFCKLFNQFINVTERIMSHHHQSQKIQIQLVVDSNSYHSILANQYFKAKLKGFDKIHNIYLLTMPNEDYKQIEEIRKKDELINHEYKTLDDLLLRHENSSMKLKEKILYNFNVIGYQSYKMFNERRMKIYSCMKYQTMDLQGQINKIQNCMRNYGNQILKQSNLIRRLSNIRKDIKQLRNAYNHFQNKSIKQFYMAMFALYQKESMFYHLLNIYVKKCADGNFQWEDMAFAVSLMYKAIKYYFQDENNRQEINNLFDQNGQCILWRAARYSKQQLNTMIRNKKSTHVYYEHVSFTSTSRDKNVAMEYLNEQAQILKYHQLKINGLYIKKKQDKDVCLFKYIIKKPKFGLKQIQKIDYIYLSFAKLLNTNQEREILLNSLTVCKFISCKDIVLNLGKYNFGQNDQFKKQCTIKEVEMRIIPNLVDHFTNKYQLENRDLIRHSPVLKSYLSTIEIIKNCNETFDKFHALQYSDHYQEAYDSLQNNIKLSKEMLKQQLQPKKKELLLRCIKSWEYRLPGLLDKMGKSQKATQLLKSLISQVQEDNKAKHTKILLKMISQQSFIMQKNGDFHKSLHLVDHHLRRLDKKINNLRISQSNVVNRSQTSQISNSNLSQETSLQNVTSKYKIQAYRFNYSEFMMLKGTLEFKQGNYEQAKQYMIKARQQVQKILQEIEYEKLKTETFYFEFIVHFILQDLMKQQDAQSYFKRRRMQKIVEATFLFGGEDNIQRVTKNAAEFQHDINNFIQTNGYNKLQPKFQLEIVQQQLSTNNPIGRIEVPQTLQTDCKCYFQQFQQLISQNQNQAKKILQEINKRFHKALIATIPVGSNIIQAILKSQNQLQTQKTKLSNFLLTNIQIQIPDKKSRFQKEIQLDELILLKKQYNRKYIQNNLQVINLQQYNTYIIHSIKYIQKLHRHYLKQGHYFSSEAKRKINDMLANLYRSKGNNKQQLKYINLNIKQIQSNVSNSSDKYNALNLVFLYLAKIEVDYYHVEFDFQYSLISKQYFRKKGISQYRSAILKRCEQQLKAAKIILQNYENYNKVYLSQYKLQDKIKQNLVKNKIAIKLWQMKVYILKIYFDLNLSTSSKRIETRQIRQYSSNIPNEIQKYIISADRQEFYATFYQTFAFFYYLINHLNNSFEYMKITLKYLTLSSSSKGIRVLTKMFFMFSQKASIKDQYLKIYQGELNRYYKRCSTSPLYWRICLAYHCYYRNQKNTLQKLNECLQYLKKGECKDLQIKLIDQCQKKIYIKYLKNKHISTTTIKQLQIFTQESKQQQTLNNNISTAQSIVIQNISKQKIRLEADGISLKLLKLDNEKLQRNAFEKLHNPMHNSLQFPILLKQRLLNKRLNRSDVK